MGRLIGIDYGRKRCGIAVTDPLCIIANGLATVATHELMAYVKQYVSKESVDKIIIGRPTTMRGEPSESMRYIEPFVARLHKELPEMEIVYWDERFTSVIAHRAMIDGGLNKSSRRDKATVDRTAATIILNDYLTSSRHD